MKRIQLILRLRILTLFNDVLCLYVENTRFHSLELLFVCVLSYFLRHPRCRAGEALPDQKRSLLHEGHHLLQHRQQQLAGGRPGDVLFHHR